ncbi:MurR/RpiR family transcriptional regulator [Roseovarius aquimarinus]|uniref:MurR/RpiR family transcriptional regulator n=1 Tax=Roseovarius aquimarinus TaxID=1229156 RepID=A0ABW7I6E7_9RHOB
MATIFDKVRAARSTLTRSEKQAADFLIRNYPVVGLERITDFAAAAKVSSATIQRLVGKLGLTGYPELRRLLTEELIETRQGPLTLSHRVQPGEQDDLMRANLIETLTRSIEGLPHDELATIAGLLGDPRAQVWLLGGAFTMPLAEHLDFHLRKLRPGVTLLPHDVTRRTDHMLNVRKGDVLVLFDVRRYQPDLAETASFVAGRGGRVVLFTDEWMSDIAHVAHHVVSCRVDVGTPWDSLVGLTAAVELLGAALDSLLWKKRGDRLSVLEAFRERAFIPTWRNRSD